MATTLRAVLPADLHHYIPPLVQLFADSTFQNTSLSEKPHLSATGLERLASTLAGQKFEAGHAVVSFGDGSSIGEVTIRDIAGQNIVKINIYHYASPPTIQPATMPEVVAWIRKHISTEMLIAVVFLGVTGAIIGSSINFVWGTVSGALLGITIGGVIAVQVNIEGRVNRRKYAFFMINAYLSYSFQERIQIELKRNWYVTPADLDDMAATYHIPSEHMDYALTHYAQEHPEQVRYAYVYDQATRLPVAYQRSPGDGRIIPIKVLVDVEHLPKEGYIVNPYPLL